MQWTRKGLALICALMLMGAVPMAWAETAPVAQFVYGQSELGRDLICHRVGSEDAEQSLLMVFGIHGFEDAFDHDGEVLGMIAQKLIAHYADHPKELKSFCLYVIPCANPDGLLDGTTQNGFGRCNANGIDINRDFPTYWSPNTSSRTRTGETAFATAEARSIRDLVSKIEPDYAVDVHGWAERAFGNGEMTQLIADAFDLKVKRMIRSSMAATWLDTVTQESTLLELPGNPDKGDYVIHSAEGLIKGINSWIEKCSQ